MLERLWIKEEFSRHWLSVFVISFIFGVFSILLTYYFIPFEIGGKNLGGLIAVLLGTSASAYPLITFLQQREKEEAKHVLSEGTLLDRHYCELVLYLTFFFGIVLSFTVCYLLLPEGFFAVQDATIADITGHIISPQFFTTIFVNNTSVFLLTFVLSFVLNAGMIFILVWNASVFGVFIAQLSDNLFSIPIQTLGYLPHGILEIGGYVFAGIAGFILSYQIEHYLECADDDVLYPHIRDSVVVLVIGFILVLLGAIVESTGV